MSDPRLLCDEDINELATEIARQIGDEVNDQIWTAINTAITELPEDLEMSGLDYEVLFDAIKIEVKDWIN